MVGSGKILVVGGNASERGFCAEALVLAGYRVEAATSGVDALKCLETGSFDAVISEADMPEMDGVVLYRAAVAQNPLLAGRFIFTGPFFPVDAETDLVASFKWLAPPLRAAELFSAVREVTGAGSIVYGPAAHLRLAHGQNGGVGMRAGARIRCTARCSITDDMIFGGRVFTARTKDISSGGAFILHDGGPLVPYMPVSFEMDCGSVPFKRDGRVAWARFFGAGLSGAGLRFFEPVKTEALKAMMIHGRTSGLRTVLDA